MASRVYVGIKEAGAGQVCSRRRMVSREANVDVWHWKDAEVQSVQVVRLAQERRSTLPAVFNVASNKLVRIADDVMRNVTPTPDPKRGRSAASIRRIAPTCSGAASKSDFL